MKLKGLVLIASLSDEIPKIRASMDALNIAVGIMSLVLGGFSIWLSLHCYERAKDAEKQTALALESIRVQGESLQKLTAKWMDRFTRHATEPRVADEGLMALVATVADLPSTILTTLRLNPGVDSSQLEPLHVDQQRSATDQSSTR